jgi:hypothetical protein
MPDQLRPDLVFAMSDAIDRLVLSWELAPCAQLSHYRIKGFLHEHDSGLASRGFSDRQAFRTLPA